MRTCAIASELLKPLEEEEEKKKIYIYIYIYITINTVRTTKMELIIKYCLDYVSWVS